MKKLLGILICLVLFCSSCQEEDPPVTGNIVVSNFTGTQSVNVGVFDMSVLDAPYEAFLPVYALMSGTLSSGTAEFQNLNPGNYIVAVVNTSITDRVFRTVQVNAGATTKVSL